MPDLNLKEYLKGLSKEELQEKWYKFFKSPALEHLNKPYLIKQIAWCMEYKSLSKEAQSVLDKLIVQYSKSKTIRVSEMKRAKKFKVTPGTKFIREYRSVKYEVTALEKGFNYNGKVYNSITAVAKAITGTNWNGKRFFGVAK